MLTIQDVMWLSLNGKSRMLGDFRIFSCQISLELSLCVSRGVVTPAVYLATEYPKITKHPWLSIERKSYHIMHGQHPLILNNIFRIMKWINNPTNEIKKISQIRPSQLIFTCQIYSVFEHCVRHPQENTTTHPENHNNLQD